MTRTGRCLAGATGLALGALLLFFGPFGPGRSKTADAPPASDRPASTRETKTPRGFEDDWRTLLDACRAPGAPAERRRFLAATKERWLGVEPDAAAGRIADLLRLGEDAATDIPFETGPGGALVGWPTLRVFLLDVLAVTDPDLAGSVAREVLASTDSAEEFAVALKPLLLGGVWKSSDAELSAHFSKLLSRPDWQTEVGLAEALDLSRAAAIPSTTAQLARWVEGNPPAAKAGEMALHETAAARPDLLVGLLAAEPDLLEDRPGLRASLMARAAVSDPGQLSAIRNYLSDPAVPHAEKREFLTLFPLRSTTTGHRLYGKPHAPFAQEAIRADDRAALEAVGTWRALPGLAPIAPELDAAEARLRGWVGQAER